MIKRILASAALMCGIAVMSPAVQGQTTQPAARAAAGVHSEPADVPVAKVGRGGAPDAGFMKLHNQYVAAAKAGNIDLYMEGDSITDFWLHTHPADWKKNFGGSRAGDFGISGDRTEHVLWRIENGELDGVTPKAIVLLIGTNNLPANTTFAANTVEDTAKGVTAIVEKLKQMEPQAHILLMGVFPREDKPLAAEIKQLNDLISKLDDGKQVKYLNINDKFTDENGKLLPGIMSARDKLHPVDHGYDVWAAEMKPILTEWLGEPGK